jgi:hypothetical protein
MNLDHIKLGANLIITKRGLPKVYGEYQGNQREILINGLPGTRTIILVMLSQPVLKYKVGQVVQIVQPFTIKGEK